VLPLHKKGSKTVLDNYRPISNICSMDKLFQRIILNELNKRYPELEGAHQHGFKSGHSTSTAMVELQNKITNELDKGKRCVLYSVDLSAAFDLLRPKTFKAMLTGHIHEDLLKIIDDFLTNRFFVVEVEGNVSKQMSLTLGCVQGSILGPKLFNLYTKDVPLHVNGNHITTYADDSYVLITEKIGRSIEEELEETLKQHLSFLKKIGMVTNLSKTESVSFTTSRDANDRQVNITIDGENFKSGSEMKVLGVYFDSELKWTKQISSVIEKAKKLNYAMKFIRNKLTFDQFMKVATCQFFSAFYYGCLTWLNPNTSYKNIRRLNAIHFRVLRIAKRDYKRKLSRATLDAIGRARPSIWAKYMGASMIVKTMTKGTPTRLYADLQANSYIERRKPKRMKFWSKADHRIGRQSIVNRAGSLLNDVAFDWLPTISDDLLRKSLKCYFNFGRVGER